MTVLSTPAFLVMKNRIPPSPANSFAPMDLSFTKRVPFWVFQFGNFMQGLAYFFPQLWIPSFAASLGLLSFAGALALCFLNIAAVIGYLGHGYLCDRLSITSVLLLSTITSSSSIFMLWGFTTSQAMLYVFSIIWGVSGGGYAATWSGKAMAMGQELRKHRHDEYTSIDTGLVIGLLCVSKGVASLISGPISEQLLNLHTSGKFAYGGQYGAIIVFAGVTALMGGTACFMKPLKVL